MTVVWFCLFVCLFVQQAMPKGAILRAAQQRMDKGKHLHYVKKASWEIAQQISRYMYSAQVVAFMTASRTPQKTAYMQFLYNRVLKLTHAKHLTFKDFSLKYISCTSSLNTLHNKFFQLCFPFCYSPFPHFILKQ